MIEYDFNAYKKQYSPFASRVVLSGGISQREDSLGEPYFSIFCTQNEEDNDINAACDALGLAPLKKWDVARQTDDAEAAAVIARRPDVFISESAAGALAVFGHVVEFHLTDDEAYDLGWSEGGRLRRLAESTQKALVQLRSASPEEVEAGYQACEILQYLDQDHARESNDEGFGGAHTWIGHYTANVARGMFGRSRKTNAWAIRLARHYREQLDTQLKTVIQSNRRNPPRARASRIRDQRFADIRAEMAANRAASRSIEQDLREIIAAGKARYAGEQAVA